MKIIAFMDYKLLPTHAIANKGFSGFRSSSPASIFVSVDSFVLRNPLLAIASTLS